MQIEEASQHLKYALLNSTFLYESNLFRMRFLRPSIYHFLLFYSQGRTICVVVERKERTLAPRLRCLAISYLMCISSSLKGSANSVSLLWAMNIYHYSFMHPPIESIAKYAFTILNLYLTSSFSSDILEITYFFYYCCLLMY